MAPLLKYAKIPFEILNATEARMVNGPDIKPCIVYSNFIHPTKYGMKNHCVNGNKIINLLCEVFISVSSKESNEEALGRGLKESVQYVKLAMRQYFGSSKINECRKCNDFDILVV